MTLLDWAIRQAYGENETGIQFTTFKELKDLKVQLRTLYCSAKGLPTRDRNSSQGIGMKWEQIKRIPENRVRWRKLVEALCSGKIEED